MVKGHRLSAVLAATCSFGLFAAPGNSVADIFYWDTNSNAAGQGSATTPVNWLTNSWINTDGGLASTIAWPNNNAGNAHTALLKGTVGAVNVAADTYVNTVRFDAVGYSLVGTNYLHFSGLNPGFTFNDATNGNRETTVSVPLTGTGGVTFNPNVGGTGLKFIKLANTNTALQPNNFVGKVTVSVGASLRIGGGAGHEQIPDNSDMVVNGAMDFETLNSASLDKQEKVRNVTVNDAGIFSIGNGSLFIANSMTEVNATNGISTNGNNTTGDLPARLWINGWYNGQANLTLTNSIIKLTPTSGTNVIGSVITLSGDIISSGISEVQNQNGKAATADTNVVTYKAFVFDKASHNINVTDGTLSFTSAATNAAGALEIQSTFAGGTTLNKIGAGTAVFENAVQTSFTGTTNVAEGTLRIGQSDRLADNSTLKISGGTFDMQSYVDSVNQLNLVSGSITGTVDAALTSTLGYAVQSGSSSAAFAGPGGLTKTTGGLVVLTGGNTYQGNTIIQAGSLKLGPQAHNNALTTAGFTDLQVGSLVFDTLTVGDRSAVIAQLDAAFLTNFSTGKFRSSTATAKKGLGWSDVGGLLTIQPALHGDTNFDGAVNYADLLTLSQYYLQIFNTTWARGDFTYSHTIDYADLLLLMKNYTGNAKNDAIALKNAGASQQFLNDFAAASVPEPTSMIWLAGAAVFAARRRRR